jgi:hypothetical protein
MNFVYVYGLYPGVVLCNSNSSIFNSNNLYLVKKSSAFTKEKDMEIILNLRSIQ